MEVPQKKSGSKAARTACSLRFRKILYRTAALVTVLACVSWPASVAFAQQERPQITPGQRKGPRKKDAEPRAVAVLKLTSDGKASLVPIAILVDGKFWDASAYKAAPVPMALEPGTVYEAERGGSSLGLFTISTALHSNAANAPVPWLATGAWVPAGADTGKKPMQAEAVPVGIDNSDAPPRLSKNPTAANTPASTPSAPSGSSPPPSSAPAPAPGSGDEPPRLSRPSSPASPAPDSTSSPSTTSGNSKGTSESNSGSNSSGSSPSGSGSSGSSQPASQTTPSQTASQPGTKPADAPADNAKPDAIKQPDHPKGPESDSGAAEANRPRLRRGKPAQSFADEDIPGYSKPGTRPKFEQEPASSANGAKAGPATAAGPVQLIPAISDSAGPDPHSYGFEWVQGDEADRRQQLVTLAQDQVRAYVDAQAKARITPPTTAPKTPASAASHRVPTKKPAVPVLSNVQMTAYDLWSTNQPIVVFSADAQMPPASVPSKKSTASSGTLSAVPQEAAPQAPGPSDALQYSILVVAYPDIYNNLHKLYAGVTDKYHLDLTPRLELIDAVDADGDGRGELLFRETSDAGSGWVIYRVTADKLWKMYDSLNPE